jgi:hypothetical protein
MFFSYCIFKIEEPVSRRQDEEISKDAIENQKINLLTTQSYQILSPKFFFSLESQSSLNY